MISPCCAPPASSPFPSPPLFLLFQQELHVPQCAACFPGSRWYCMCLRFCMESSITQEILFSRETRTGGPWDASTSTLSRVLYQRFLAYQFLCQTLGLLLHSFFAVFQIAVAQFSTRRLYYLPPISWRNEHRTKVLNLTRDNIGFCYPFLPLAPLSNFSAHSSLLPQVLNYQQS